MADLSEIQRAHRMVWDFRERASSWWPTPDREDALRFAVTEAAEALDAWLRANRPQYARNRDRLNGDEAVLDELADCAMMLLTAIGPDHANWWGRFDDATNLDQIVAWVSSWLSADECFDASSITSDVRWIANYPGMDLCTRIQSRLERIEGKHNPAAIRSGPQPYIISRNGHKLDADRKCDTPACHYAAVHIEADGSAYCQECYRDQLLSAGAAAGSVVEEES